MMPYLSEDILGLKRNVYGTKGEEVDIVSHSPPVYIVQSKKDKFPIHENQLTNIKTQQNEKEPHTEEICVTRHIEKKQNKIQRKRKDDLHTPYPNTLF